MAIQPTQSFDSTVFDSVESMPATLIQELEIYYKISEEGIARCLEEKMSVAEIKDLCRSIHARRASTLH